MPAENAKQFLERLTIDAALRAQFRSAGSATLNTALDFALSHGFDFTQQDLKSALVDFPDSPVINQLRDMLKIRKAVRPH